MMLSRDDKGRVVRGQVLYHDQWITIEEKEAQEKEFRKRLEEGYVFYQNEWMTIDDKLARIRTAQAPPQQSARQNVYYQTLNKQTYNVQNTDSRSYQQIYNEHRHVHLDPNALPPGWQQGQQLPGSQQHPYQQLGPQQEYYQVPPHTLPPSQQRPPLRIERQLPPDAPEYFYGEDEPENGKPRPPTQ